MSTIRVSVEDEARVRARQAIVALPAGLPPASSQPTGVRPQPPAGPEPCPGRIARPRLSAGGTCPPLPAQAQLDPHLAEGACPWLDAYIAFSRHWSPRAYDGFHEAVGLWVLSTVAAGRVMMHFGGERYPSLFIALCARTSLYTKSTVAKIGVQVLKAAGLEWLLLSDTMTPQKLIRDMAGELPEDYGSLAPHKQERIRRRLVLSGQRGWFFDEFGQHMTSMMRPNSVMADFRGLLRRLDDHQDLLAYGTISRGEDVVEQPYLALLANLTPAELQPYARPGGPLWHDGFFARFAFVAPRDDGEDSGDLFPAGHRVVPEEVVAPLMAWHQRLGTPAVQVRRSRDASGAGPACWQVDRDPLVPVECTASPEVWQAFRSYCDALLRLIRSSPTMDLDGNYARLAEKALRVAMLIASLDPRTGNQISLRHWALAQQIAERWRADLHCLVDMLAAPGPSQGQQVEDRIAHTLQRLCAQGHPPTAREIRQYTKGVTTEEVERVLAALVRSGAARREIAGKTVRYHLAEEPELGPWLDPMA